MIKYTVYHVVIFIETFVGYALLHGTRKSFSNVKKTISDQWTPSFHNATVNATQPDHLWNAHNMFKDVEAAEYFLGVLDTSWLIAYAVGLFVSGTIGDRFDLRKLLAFGMCSSSITVLMFGTVSEWLGIYSMPYYAFFWVATGVLQSVGWPCVVTVMGNWFGRDGRGLIFGVWGSCASVGNIMGTLMAAGMLQYGYQYSFLLPAALQFCGGVIIFFTLVPTPKEIGLPEADTEKVIPADGDIQPKHSANQKPTGSERDPLLVDSDSEDDPFKEQSDTRGDAASVTASIQQSSGDKSTRQKPITFLQALRLPGVLLYSSAYGCLMCVNYAFLFWLPFYLTSKFGWGQVESDQNSIFYDIGGITGAIIVGFITDKLPMRSPMLVVSLVIALPALYVYSQSPNNRAINAVLIALVGFFIDGPVNLIGSAIAADLGRQDKVLGTREALATVTGIVDGTGNFGAGLSQILIPIIQLNLGWQSVFYLLMIMDGLTICCILPVVVGEVRHWRQRRIAERHLH